MRKYSVVIVFPVLFILALLNPGFIHSEKTARLSSISASNNSFGTDLNYPHSEIEHCNLQGSIPLQGSPVSQRIPGYPVENAKGLPISSLSFGNISIPPTGLFDNNYLLHNYSSHNFW
ncbi:MAG TPA: hypothetical protein VK489_03230 [Ferruginibacter sp.]|nr:hypothetical protein [Ferruginibacter sp.]